MKLGGIAEAAHPPAADRSEAARIGDVARQFEALLLSAMLKSMREAGSGGWLGSGEDQAGAMATELAEEQFAQALAAQGGLGLAALLASGLKRTR